MKTHLIVILITFIFISLCLKKGLMAAFEIPIPFKTY